MNEQNCQHSCEHLQTRFEDPRDKVLMRQPLPLISRGTSKLGLSSYLDPRVVRDGAVSVLDRCHHQVIVEESPSTAVVCDHASELRPRTDGITHRHNSCAICLGALEEAAASEKGI